MQKTTNKILDFFFLDIINAYKKLQRMRDENTAFNEKNENENISLNKKNEDEIYEKIMIEIEEDKKVKSTWARALSQSDGNKEKAESLYINLRVNQIIEEQ